MRIGQLPNAAVNAHELGAWQGCHALQGNTSRRGGGQ